MQQKYKLETITPVHIGSGDTLNHIDGYYANDKWHRIDLDKVLAHPSTNINALTSEMSEHSFRWSSYFSRHNIDPADLSTYSLLCSQSPETTDIREAVKSTDNRPYIPGSSIKGALRTALLSELIVKDNNVFQDSLRHLQNLIRQGTRGNPTKEAPARNIEQKAFGKDPNHDLLRALQVSDTEPLESDALEIGTAWTVTLNQNDQLVQKIEKRQEYKNFVQQIQAKQTLTFTVKTDELFFREREKTRLDFNDLQENTLKNIAKVCHSDADALMKYEQDFFDYYKLTEIANRYDTLIALNDNALSDNAFMLQIGWGTGYNANTVTAIFTADNESPDDLLINLRERFRLGQSRSQRGRYDERDFPKTRRILYRGQNPIAPLGWVKISPIAD